MLLEKYCPKCSQTKPSSEWVKNKNSLDGLGSYCKQCFAARARENRANNPEAYQAELDKRKKTKYHQKYYKKNQQTLLAFQKKYREENPEKVAQAKKDYYAKNKEQEDARKRKWARENKGRVNESAKQSRLSCKIKALNAYGGVFCNVCGETNPFKLELDHINGDGTKHRESINRSTGADFYRYLSQNNFPQDPPLQVLCKTCHKFKTVEEQKSKKIGA